MKDKYYQEHRKKQAKICYEQSENIVECKDKYKQDCPRICKLFDSLYEKNIERRIE